MPALPWDASTFRPQDLLVGSYVLDWAVTLASTLVWLYLGIAHPHYRPFSVDDKSISYPYVPPGQQMVTVPTLFILAIAVPACAIVAIALGLKRSMHDLHVGLLGLLMGVSLTLMFTNCLKNVVGEPRPSLLARCLPVKPAHPLSDPPQGLSTVDICTQSNTSILDEGFRSFPSGHTSLAFAGLTYLTFYLAGKLHIFDRQGHTYKPFAVFLPLLVAAVVGATRVADYWHHPTDVLFGAAIGMCTATFSYHQYYPPAITPYCDRPYDPRIRPAPILPLCTPGLHGDNASISLVDTNASPSPRAPGFQRASSSASPADGLDHYGSAARSA
ncbi:hypothetical protein LPJ61_001128 [Coemansia biformis]|uniref:Phosphatidic acid phosphatase type 2/haloperoxidase domain-containing protein n=1 Tax=Coemansia biformis TaxID=1286918 RepID=A0A9W7YAK4_9FUNG|nr:hypothetical protein LPJ61_001128 [Coemansia biformis]